MTLIHDLLRHFSKKDLCRFLLIHRKKRANADGAIPLRETLD
jgi:hypothetical protein